MTDDKNQGKPILARGEQYNIKLFVRICWVMAVLAILIALICGCVNYHGAIEYYNNSDTYMAWFVRGVYSSPHKYGMAAFAAAMKIGMSIAAPIVAVGIFINVWLSNTIVVTDKRIYGKTTFNRRIDLPLDSISAVGTCWLKGLTVATTSRKASFLMLKNRDDTYECISNLLIERQNRTTN